MEATTMNDADPKKERRQLKRRLAIAWAELTRLEAEGDSHCNRWLPDVLAQRDYQT